MFLMDILFEKDLRPVPDGIAAVIATIDLSFLACLIRESANTFV